YDDDDDDDNSTTTTGINTTNLHTEYAYQGLSPLQTSLNSLAQNPPFARQLYIHALVYLLQGLPAPASLAEHELASLRTVLPDGVFPAAAATPGDRLIDDDGNDNSDHASKARRERRRADNLGSQHAPPPPLSLLHRAVSIVVFFLVSAAQGLRPWLHALLSTLVFYDERYGIHGRAAVVCSTLARSFWVWVTENVDPRLLIWFGSEVTRGIGEGWRRGLKSTEIT
ncbi:MAG: hypothetical protein Q9210_001615, partial [Variospora velana]